MNDKKTIVIVIVTAIIVAAVVSMVTANITGNSVYDLNNREISVREASRQDFAADGNVYTLKLGKLIKNEAGHYIADISITSKTSGKTIQYKLQEGESVPFSQDYEIYPSKIDSAKHRVYFTITAVEPLTQDRINQNLVSLLNNCQIYSVSSPDPNREVTGNDICEDRSAGSCLFTVQYTNVNDAINGGNSPIGSNLGIIESCTSGKFKSTETVALCCAA